MPLEKPFKARPRQPRQLGIAHGMNGRDPRLSGDERHLADRFPGAELGDWPQRSVRLCGADTQASTEDDVHVFAGVPLAHQDLATVQGDELERGFEIFENGRVQITERAMRVKGDAKPVTRQRRTQRLHDEEHAQRVALPELYKALARERRDLDAPVGARGAGHRRIEQQVGLAEYPVASHARHLAHDTAAGRGVNLELAGQHDEHPIAVLSLVDERLARSERQRRHVRGERAADVIRQVAKHVGLAQRVRDVLSAPAVQRHRQVYRNVSVSDAMPWRSLQTGSGQ